MWRGVSSYILRGVLEFLGNRLQRQKEKVDSRTCVGKRGNKAREKTKGKRELFWYLFEMQGPVVKTSATRTAQYGTGRKVESCVSVGVFWFLTAGTGGLHHAPPCHESVSFSGIIPPDGTSGSKVVA